MLAILGLTNYGPYGSQAIHVNTNLVKPQSGSSSDCLALTGLPDACNLPSNFASNYGLDGLYNEGADGSGQTIAIVTLAALDPGAPEYFWSNVAHVPSTGRSVTVDKSMAGRARRATRRARARPTWTLSSRGRGSRRERDRLPGAQHRLSCAGCHPSD